MESSLYWFKPVAEIKKEKKTKWKKQPLGGMLSALLVMPAAMAVQRQAVCWRHIGLLETHCLPVFTRNTNNPRCGLLLTLLWAETSAQTRILQFSCALTFVQWLLLFPEAQKKNTAKFPIFIPAHCLVLETAAQSTESAVRWSLQWQYLLNRPRLENRTHKSSEGWKGSVWFVFH